MKPKNQINIEEQFLKMYVEKASREELEHIDQLLDQKDYEEIDRIVEEYTYRIINNRDLKDLGTDGDGGIGEVEIELVLPNEPKNEEVEEKFSTEDMDPQTFELFCILKLINAYGKEENKDKKNILENQIQAAIETYRSTEKSSPKPGRVK